MIFPPDALLVIFNTSTLVKAKLLTCTRTTRKYKNMCGNKTNKMLKQATNTKTPACCSPADLQDFEGQHWIVVLSSVRDALQMSIAALCFRHVVQYNITACESKGAPHLHFLLPASIFPSPSFCLRDQASLFLICGKNFNSSFM